MMTPHTPPRPPSPEPSTAEQPAERRPLAFISKVRDALDHPHPNRRVRTVTVICPFCDKNHIHGWPANHDVTRARLSHCTTRAPQTYELAFRDAESHTSSAT